jgi:hypothetical protein
VEEEEDKLILIQMRRETIQIRMCNALKEERKKRKNVESFVG